MSKHSHTPGPWRVEQGTALVWGACNPDDRTTYGMGYPIIECRISPASQWAATKGPTLDEGEANARLIAQAPAMLEALRGLLSLNDNHAPFGGEMHQDRIDRAWDKARSVIAAATGEAS